MEENNKSHTILVVDDNPKNIQVVVSILRNADFEIGFALNGRQALDMLNHSPDYDLVLMDIKMPGMSGFQVCKIMKGNALLKDIPVIFISASHEIENIITAFEAGGVDYVMKPFNSMELMARVNTHLQLKRKTKEAEMLAKDLAMLNLTKDKFFSIIAHDLRNPFEGILILCRSLLSKLTTYSSDELREQIEMIAGASDSGYKLLENLLNWSRSQMGSITFHPVQFDLEPLVMNCIHSVSSQAEMKKISVEYLAEKNIHLNADKDILYQIIFNLLTNAVKFTEISGSVTIHAMAGDGIVEIVVEDTGIGIPKKDINNLFRIDGNVASRPGTLNEMGSGLGLILCKEFIDKMGGRIEVESQVAKGSRFRVVIPAHD